MINRDDLRGALKWKWSCYDDFCYEGRLNEIGHEYDDL